MSGLSLTFAFDIGHACDFDRALTCGLAESHRFNSLLLTKSSEPLLLREALVLELGKARSFLLCLARELGIARGFLFSFARELGETRCFMFVSIAQVFGAALLLELLALVVREVDGFGVLLLALQLVEARDLRFL